MVLMESWARTLSRKWLICWTPCSILRSRRPEARMHNGSFGTNAVNWGKCQFIPSFFRMLATGFYLELSGSPTEAAHLGKTSYKSFEATFAKASMWRDWKDMLIMRSCLTIWAKQTTL
jgi:hypothetical protein